MGIQFFAFLIFMSFVSFCLAFLVYALVRKTLGTQSTAAKTAQYIGIPVAIIGYNFLVIASGAYCYVVGAVPMLAVAAIYLYYRFGNNGANYDAPAPSDFKREESKKSRRIHEARAKRKGKNN